MAGEGGNKVMYYWGSLHVSSAKNEQGRQLSRPREVN